MKFIASADTKEESPFGLGGVVHSRDSQPGAGRAGLRCIWGRWGWAAGGREELERRNHYCRGERAIFELAARRDQIELAKLPGAQSGVGRKKKAGSEESATPVIGYVETGRGRRRRRRRHVLFLAPAARRRLPAGRGVVMVVT